MLGSTLIGAGFQLDAVVHVLAGLGLLGALLTLLVPMARAQFAPRAAPVDAPAARGPASPWWQAV